MNILKISRLIGCIVLSTALVGCRTFVPSDTETTGTSFHGISQIASQTNIPVRVLLIHGVSHHDPGWATNYLNPIIEKLDWQFDGAGTRQAVVDVQGISQDGTFAAQLRRYTITDGTSPRIIAYELTWSPLVDPFKESRFTNDFYWRPYVNGEIRTAIDTSLADAVLYTSKFDNDIMARSVSQALTMFCTGQLDEKDGSASQKDLDKSPVVFISESLGSKMLFDAIQEHDNIFQKANDITTTFTASTTSHFHSMVANTENVFMMANQLALLDMPTPEDYGPVPVSQPASEMAYTSRSLSSFDYFVKLRAKYPKHLFLIAFNDLYDVLSWKVEKRDISVNSNNVTIDNFTPVNAFDWFWFMESIQDAHTTYDVNSDVIDTVVNGFQSKKDKKTP